MQFFSFHSRRVFTDAGERIRRFHEAWLDRAVRQPAYCEVRIPVRRVDDGGFSTLTAAPGGRERANQWWFEAFAYMESIE